MASSPVKVDFCQWLQENFDEAIRITREAQANGEEGPAPAPILPRSKPVVPYFMRKAYPKK